MGFPTANISVRDRILPCPGVYASIARSAGGRNPAITYFGSSPTFKDGKVQLETHLFGHQGDLYGRLLHVEFYKKIRSAVGGNIKYFISDASDLKDLEDDNFDIVVSNLAFMDIENIYNTIKECSRVLKTNGKIIFSLVIPIFGISERSKDND